MVYSYTAIAQPVQPLKDYVIEVWSAVEGLPSNNLRHIAKDSRGFLWISTFNGVVRFDGNKFKTFDTNNIPEISTSAFYSVTTLKDGSMYLATQSSGVIEYIDGEFRKAFEGSDIPSAIQLVYQGFDRTWIASRNAGLYYFDGKKVLKYDIPEFNDQSIMCFTHDANGKVWVASEGAGVARIDDGFNYTLFTTEDGLASDIVNALIFHDGFVYTGTESGLSYYDGKVWKNDERFTNININDIVADNKSNLWFATGVGLGRISHPNKFEFIGEEEGLPSRQVSSIIFDDEENVWVTTKRGGLIELKLSSFKNITPSTGLSYQGVNVVSESPDHTFYVGSDNGDVDVIDNGKIKRVQLKTDLNNVSIKDIFADDETLWLATYKGLIKKTRSSEHLYTEEDGLLSIKTRRITKDKDGVLWIGSRNGGINKVYPDGRIEAIGPEQGLGSDFVFSIDEAPDGRMVVGTDNGGLNIFDRDGRVKIYKPDSTITGLSIFNVYIENDKLMWLATNVGLYCFFNNEFHLINPSVGLKAETIFDVVEDLNGSLWMTSIYGVIRLNKAEAFKYVTGELDKVTSSVLDDSDGMVSKECTGATRSLKASDGTILIPTIKGVAILNPAQIILNKKPPSVYIENIIVDDKPLKQFICCTQGLKFDIEPGHRNYTIDFTSVSMYSPGKISFKYMLDGFDDEWVDAGTNRQAKYTNLPYGEYTFKVIATNNDGVSSTEPAEIMLHVEPYFYETRTFIVLLIIGFVVFTVTLYLLQTSSVQGRNRELTKLNRELDSFTYSVSHDLKAPLTSIQGLLNVARLEKGEHALAYYDKIETSVNKLDQFIKDIIDYSKNARATVKKEPINVLSTINSMLDGLSYLSDKKEIRTEVSIDNDLVIKTDKTRFLFILNNLLTNAFRYADLEKHDPFVKVSAAIEGDKLTISIVDNGQGIKKEHQSKIFEMFYRANEGSSGSGLGLYIVKESVAKLKGKIKLESEFGVGTSVYVMLPVTAS